MTDAPERIWAWPLLDWGQGGSSAAGQWQEPDRGHEHYDYKMKGALYVRALPLPSDADMLAAALRLPEIAALVAAADGLSRGEDWNNGTHAKKHGYRTKLLAALAALKGDAK